MRAHEFLGIKKHRPTREGARPRRGHQPVPRYKHQAVEENLNPSRAIIQSWLKKTNIDSILSINDIEGLIKHHITPNGEIDVNGFSEEGASLIPWTERWGAYDEFVANFEELANSLNSPEQLDELDFMGMSPCTKDCSGHEAGYKWSKARGGVSTASQSDSFNRGAEIARAGY